ncbi:MAG: VapC toxin family PIN domain ribonuclease [Methylomonas sp.]|nr:MAG: VapC toxin family PIN domain ribonuclease [Methylomonas sp.]
MIEKFFADTNIVLYTIGRDIYKLETARKIISTKPLISVQVINESVNVCLRKLAFTKEKAYFFADNIMRRTIVVSVDESTVRKSAEIAIKYQTSNWDALIIAAAILSDCNILYSEDLQHGQKFEDKLTPIPSLNKIGLYQN